MLALARVVVARHAVVVAWIKAVDDRVGGAIGGIAA